jgi:hypothetical protein
VKFSRVRKMIQDSFASAAKCKIDAAIKALQTNKAVYDTLAPESADIEVVFSKMIRRLNQYKQTEGNLVSSEICSQ